MTFVVEGPRRRAGAAHPARHTARGGRVPTGSRSTPVRSSRSRLPAATRTVRLEGDGGEGRGRSSKRSTTPADVVGSGEAADSIRARPATIELRDRGRVQAPARAHAVGPVPPPSSVLDDGGDAPVSIPITAYDGPIVVETSDACGPARAADGRDPADVRPDHVGRDRRRRGGPRRSLRADRTGVAGSRTGSRSQIVRSRCFSRSRHPDYPLAQRAPVTYAAARRQTALQRVVYGPTAGPGGRELRVAARYVSSHWWTADRRGRPRAQMAAPERAARRTSPVFRVRQHRALDAPQRSPRSTRSISCCSESLHPAVAQMVGLYWADKTANPPDALRLPDRRRPSQRRRRQGLRADRLHRAATEGPRHQCVDHVRPQHDAARRAARRARRPACVRTPRRHLPRAGRR